MFPVVDQDGNLYEFLRLPMGFKWSCNIAQATMLYLTKGIKCRIEVYIDNVLFIGTESEVSVARGQFLDACRKYRITLGEDSGVKQVVQYRGIEFDFEKKHTCLAGSFRSKFLSRSASSDSTWVDWRSLIGSATYGAMVLDIDLAQLYHLLKMHAKYSNHTFSTERITLWKEASKQWNAIYDKIRVNEPRQVLNPTDEITVITDAATETGLGGAVLVLPSGRIVVDQFRLNDWHHNNDMEAMSLHATLGRHQQLLSFRKIRYLGDNTAVLGCLGSGHSKGFYLNLQVGRILGRLRNMSSTISSEYICTLCNPADAPSRGECLSSRHLRVLHGLRPRQRSSPDLPSEGGGGGSEVLMDQPCTEVWRY